MINSEQLQAAISAIEEKKGRETIILDLRGISQVTDYFFAGYRGFFHPGESYYR